MKNHREIDRVTVDSGRVRIGAVAKLLPTLPLSVKDAGRVKLGAVAKLLALV